MFARPPPPTPPPNRDRPNEKASRANDWTARNQVEAAGFFGVAVSTFQLWTKQGCPGKPGNYPLAEIVQWLRTSGPWRPYAKGSDGADDPMLAAGDSPGLERYRLAKAGLAELELQERHHTLLPVDKVRDVLLRWATLLRRLGERLGKRYGAEAAGAVSDCLNECGRVVDDLRADTDP